MDRKSMFFLGLVLCGTSSLSLAGETIFPGRNANVVGPPPSQSDAFGDTGYRQQNEPSCAVNPENPSRVCCGFNDYRGIDIPALGDAWQGIACSIDGGDSWNSQLIEGSLLDPENSLGLEFAADPNLVAMPGGLVFNFIAANRDQVGGLYVMRYLWRNKEDGWPLQSVGGPVLVSSGSSGRFIDKPHFHGFLDDNSSETVRWAGTDRDLPAGTLGLSAAVFVGNDNNDGTKLMYWRSEDWGATWENPTKLSESKGVNSGVNLAANGDTVCAVWRRFGDTNEVSSILKACSNDRGRRFEKPKEIIDICPFDQTTLNGSPPLDNFVSFRSNAFPVLAGDGSNFYAFWSDRGYADASDGLAGCELLAVDPQTGEDAFNPSFGRIVYSVSSNGGKNWSAPTPVEDNVQGVFPGHQFMPAAYGANGEVLLSWIDTRDDVTNQYRALGFDPPVDKQLIVDFWDEGEALYRHSADIRSIRLDNGVVTGSSVQVSNYANGLFNFGAGLEFLQLEYNLVNARMFQQGTAPFVGDYLNVTALGFNQDASGKWQNSNSAPVVGSPVFHVAWGDNRDVRGNAWGEEGFDQPSPYTPVGQSAQTSGAEVTEQETSNSNPSVQDPPDDQQLSCEAVAQPADRTRDQNVYAAAIYPEITMRSPGAIKLSGLDLTGLKPLRRAIPVVVQNNTSSVKQIELAINAQPAGGRASFSQDAQLSTQLTVKVWGNSSAVRTVFVSTSETAASTSIPVTATLCSVGSCSSAATARVVLNEDPLDLEQPDYGSSSIAAQETHDPAILNPGLLNPDVVRLLLQEPTLIEILITAGLLPPAFTLADLFNESLVTAETLALLQANPDLLDAASFDPGLLSLLLDNPELLNRALLELDASTPGLLAANLLNPGLQSQAFWDLVREGENLELLLGAIANPNFLDDLADNPAAIGPDLLDLIVQNPTLLNPTLLNILVGNPRLLNFELENPRLLNPTLLNTLVSNPRLLNSSVFDGLVTLSEDPAYPADGNQDQQLDYVQANYAANLELIEAVVSNPRLLNPTLLNPRLLNPTLLNDLVANPTLLNPRLLNPNLLNPRLLNPTLLNPTLLNPDLLNPDLLNQVLLNPTLLNLVVANPRLLNPRLLNENLLNPTLLNQLVANPTLLNPRLLNPTLLNPRLLNPTLLNAPLDAYASLENAQTVDAPAGVTPGEDHYIDVTWQVQNTGNTTTGYMAQPYIAGAGEPDGVEGLTGSQLIVSKPYLRQSVSDCQQVLRTDNNVIVNIPNPRVLEPIENPDPTDADTAGIVEGLGSFWLSPGEVANVTMRVFGSGDALVSGRVGLYVNSEACTSGVDASTCATALPFALVERDFVGPEFADLAQFLEQFSEPFEATGPEGAEVYYDSPPASDEGDGGFVPVVCDFPSGATFPVGESAHDCVAMDASGNESSVEFDVTVSDTEPPEVDITPPAGFEPVLEATGPDGVSVDFSEWDITASDFNGVDPEPQLSCTLGSEPAEPDIPLHGSFTLPLGQNTVTCSAVDASGNQSEVQSIDINVQDTTPPVLTIPSASLSIIAEATSAAGAAVSYDITVFEVSDLVEGSIASNADSVSCSPASGANFALGSSAVSCVASDGAGNSGDAVTFEVLVTDTTAPDISLPGAIVVEASANSGSTVGYAVSASDLVDAPVGIACTPPPGSVFSIGATVVACTAQDNSGNTRIGSFTVSVVDTIQPDVTVPADITVEAEAPFGTVVEYVASAVDLDDPLALACSRESGSIFPIGQTQVNCTAVDASGNSSTASFLVTVQDSIPPVLNLPDPIIVEAENMSGAEVNYTVTAYDVASEEVTVACTPPSGELFEIGTTVVECIATDAQGVQNTGSFDVTVNGVPIVWIRPQADPYFASIGPNLQLLWGYGEKNALIDSRRLLDKQGKKGTAPVEIYYLGAGEECLDAAPQVVNLDAGNSSLRYGSGEWLLNWQTGQSDIPGDGLSGLQPGCYRVTIPRTSGLEDTRDIILK